MRATKYYFDNIIGPFKHHMLKALDKIKDLDVDMICTGHGPVLDCRLDEMKETYKKWCTVINPNPRKTVIIPYVSVFGSYGWSGEGVPHIVERLKQLKMKVVDGFRVRFKLGEKDLKDAYEYGFNFGCLLLNKENKNQKLI